MARSNDLILPALILSALIVSTFRKLYTGNKYSFACVISELSHSLIVTTEALLENILNQCPNAYNVYQDFCYLGANIELFLMEVANTGLLIFETPTDVDAMVASKQG